MLIAVAQKLVDGGDVGSGRGDHDVSIGTAATAGGYDGEEVDMGIS